jgi:thiol-disulfide isomerase/thioredoxin
MKKRVFLFVLFVCGLGASANAQIVWLKDYNAALKAAQESGKPMLLDFTASWCGPCRTMEKVFWTRSDVIEVSKDFVCVKIDADKNADLKNKYGVRGIPNITITNPWGELFLNHIGFPKNGEQQIIAKLGVVPKDFKAIKDAKILLETDKNNLPALAKIAEFYQQQKLYYQSNETYKQILKLEKNPQQRENLLIIIGFNYLRIDADEARKSFENFATEFPKSPQLDMAIYGQFLAFERQSKFQKAQEMFDRLKKEFPKSSLILQAEQIMPQKK